MLLIVRFLQHEHHLGRPINQVSCESWTPYLSLPLYLRSIFLYPCNHFHNVCNLAESGQPFDGFLVLLWVRKCTWTLFNNDMGPNICISVPEALNVNRAFCSLLEQLLLSMLHIIRNLNARNIFDPRHMRISIQGSGIYLNRERGHR